MTLTKVCVLPSTLLKDARRREVKPFKDEKLWGGWVLQPLQEQYTVEKMDILQLLSSDEHQPEIFLVIPCDLPYRK